MLMTTLGRNRLSRVERQPGGRAVMGNPPSNRSQLLIWRSSAPASHHGPRGNSRPHIANIQRPLISCPRIHRQSPGLARPAGRVHEPGVGARRHPPCKGRRNERRTGQAQSTASGFDFGQGDGRQLLCFSSPAQAMFSSAPFGERLLSDPAYADTGSSPHPAVDRSTEEWSGPRTHARW